MNAVCDGSNRNADGNAIEHHRIKSAMGIIESMIEIEAKSNMIITLYDGYNRMHDWNSQLKNHFQFTRFL